MPTRRTPYPLEFRQPMVELDRAGRTLEELSRAFEPSAQSIRKWVAWSDGDEGRGGDELTSTEREELRQEREILARSAAWFARETGSILPRTAGGSSRS